MEKQRILIVDDDEHIAELISLYLIKECFDTRIEGDGIAALQAFEEYRPHLILLDIMLPGMDGYEVCSQIRKQSPVPIIMLSAKGEVFDKVLGLKLGADDYIMKPFDSNEMVARVRAVLRRYQPAPAAPTTPVNSNLTSAPHTGDYVEYENLIVNISNYTTTINGTVLEMPPKELELLYFLASRPNQVFTREQLLDQLWGYEYIGDTRTVDVHIKRIREKLPENSNWALTTVWGVGYKFEVKS
ncbi:MAG: response regulator transcription factor [Clostridium sp.]|nr:response regulator transcription factor [Clostridium sp.]